jgi:hypothetical protein
VNVLLVSPEFPKTYWGAEYTTGFTGKRSAFPPLGLLTVASLLPSDCDARLADLNVGPLGDEALRWADLVLVGAQIVQSKSFHAVIARAKALGKRVIAGGPYPTTSPARCSDADHLLLGEAEEVFSTFFEQVRAGDAPKVVQGTRPDLSKSPVPRYDLLIPGAYNSLSVQFSRGCPFHCEFCDIIEIYGRVSRSKPPEQLLAELDAIRGTGHSGSLFMVDDNFIGNKGKALALVNAIERWQRAHRYPFDLFTEASINLAKEPVLLAAMVRAGFSGVFVGIETPARRGLEEAGKSQNIHVDLDAAVDILTRAGLEVMSGFIVGFDSDDEVAFERQRAFIQANPIPVARPADCPARNPAHAAVGARRAPRGHSLGGPGRRSQFPHPHGPGGAGPRLRAPAVAALLAFRVLRPVPARHSAARAVGDPLSSTQLVRRASAGDVSGPPRAGGPGTRRLLASPPGRPPEAAQHAASHCVGHRGGTLPQVHPRGRPASPGGGGRLSVAGQRP